VLWFMLWLGLAGCGALAEIASDDGQKAMLHIEPRAYIFQGQRENFSFTFIPTPPWQGADVGFSYLVHYEFGEGIRASRLDYNGAERLEALLTADNQAVPGYRRIVLSLGYQQAGKPQIIYTGEGMLAVYPRSQADGGSDAADGGLDGGEQ